MADDARNPEGRDERPASEAALSARLARLGRELGQVEASRPVEPGLGTAPASDASGIARGFRLSTELVAGVLVGAGIGWLLDRWLGISPWGLIVFLLLGFVAGVLNVMRAAGVVAPNKLDGSDRSH
jgi:ATP synthase protein I